MSNDQKAMQIGQVVAAYQQAKTELAHIEKRLRTCGSTYQKAAELLTQGNLGWGHRIEGGSIVLIDNYAGIDLTSDLLNAKDLAMLLEERIEAVQKVSQARAEMNSLGIVVQ